MLFCNPKVPFGSSVQNLKLSTYLLATNRVDSLFLSKFGWKCLPACRLYFNFVNAINCVVYACTQFMYVTVVFECKQLRLHTDYSFVFISFYKMFHNSLRQFMNNLYSVLKHFVHTQALYSYIGKQWKHSQFFMHVFRKQVG